MGAPLKLAVVGHTNTGKTSLLRTLTRDTAFGDVAARPSATRHVQGARLLADNESIIELYDTPGLEDAMSLWDTLEQQSFPNERLDGPARITRFLASPAAQLRFEQEAKALRQLLASDAGLVVIDVRDPVLAKYRDELGILVLCGKPLLPVFNFVHGAEMHAEAWREALARLGLHSVILFDAIVPAIDGEQRLFAKLALMLERHAAALERLMAARRREADERRQSALELIASLLIDAAAYRILVPRPNDDKAAEAAEHSLQSASELMRERLRQREAACVRDLLTLYRFREHDVQASGLPLAAGRWEHDLFSRDALGIVGIKLGKGMTVGAATGIGLDLILGGLTLGAATLAGAAVGGLWQLGHVYGDHILGALRGYRTLTAEDAILRLLALRQLWLLDALQRRGHAATQAVALDSPEGQGWRKDGLPAPLLKARSHGEWSSLNQDIGDDEARTQAVHDLREFLS
ncbi:MAG: GTPase/DUF3482 domain-containing protein [Pseudomonadota bacterium]